MVEGKASTRGWNDQVPVVDRLDIVEMVEMLSNARLQRLIRDDGILRNLEKFVATGAVARYLNSQCMRRLYVRKAVKRHRTELNVLRCGGVLFASRASGGTTPVNDFARG